MQADLSLLWAHITGGTLSYVVTKYVLKFWVTENETCITSPTDWLQSPVNLYSYNHV